MAKKRENNKTNKVNVFRIENTVEKQNIQLPIILIINTLCHSSYNNPLH